MNKSKFGDFIYELRKKEGLSQAGLAKQIGVTNEAVSKWENGKAKPAVFTLRRIAILYDIPIEKLLLLKHEADVEGRFEEE